METVDSAYSNNDFLMTSLINTPWLNNPWQFDNIMKKGINKILQIYSECVL